MKHENVGSGGEWDGVGGERECISMGTADHGSGQTFSGGHERRVESEIAFCLLERWTDGDAGG